MKTLKYDPNRWPLFIEAKKFIRPVHTVLDVGPGIRPQRLVQCERLICLEPHHEYVKVLHQNNVDAIQGIAPRGLHQITEPVDTVTLIDVIEHMDRTEGFLTIQAAQDLALQQVIVFTPLGFMEQEQDGPVDAWGMQGQQWQRHRSGWTVIDFPGWKTLVDERFHKRPPHGAFFAIWTRP